MEVQLLIFTDCIRNFKIDYLKNVNPKNYRILTRIEHLMGVRDAVILKRMYGNFRSNTDKSILSDIQRHIEIRNFNVIDL